MIRLYDFRLSSRRLAVLAACVITLALTGCLPSSEPDNNDSNNGESGAECTSDEDCPWAGEFCQDGYCTHTDPGQDVGDAEDGTSGDVSCDAGERFNPVSGECVSSGGG